jgi:hypothetical protein
MRRVMGKRDNDIGNRQRGDLIFDRVARVIRVRVRWFRILSPEVHHTHSYRVYGIYGKS